MSDGGEPELQSLSEGPQYADPFGPTANLAAYVPCEAMERALSQLVRTVRSERRAAAISGPPGLGKTLLLHLLASRLGRQMQCVYIPYAALPAEGLCAWALELLGTQASDDPIAMIKAYGEHLRQQGSALLVLIDDAGALPIESARVLGNLVAASEGGLRLAAASVDSPEASRALAALGCDIKMIRLIEPMTEAETRRYVESRLAMGRLPGAICARFDDETMGALHRMSGGVPRRLNALASAVMRGIASDAAAAHLDGEDLEDAARAQEPPPEPEPPVEQIVGDAPEPEPVPVDAAAAPGPTSVAVDAATAPEPKSVTERQPPPGPPPRARRARPSVQHAVLVGAVVVAVLLGISILRLGPSTPSLGGESARPAAASRAAPEPERPEPRAAAVPAAEDPWAGVAPEPAGTEGRRRIALEPAPAGPVRAAPDEAPDAQPVAVGEAEEVEVVEEEAAPTPTQAEVAEEEEVAPAVEPPPVLEEAVTAAVEDEPAATPTQQEVAEVADEQEAAIDSEAPPAREEVATAAVEPDLASSSEEDAAEPEPPPLESPAPAVSFPVQINAIPWATIEIDGRDFGETPLAGIPLPPGPHSFRARMPDGRVVERVVEIDAENRFVVFE